MGSKTYVALQAADAENAGFSRVEGGGKMEGHSIQKKYRRRVFQGEESAERKERMAFPKKDLKEGE